MAGADVKNARRVKPGTDTPDKLDLKVWCSEAVTKYDILYIFGTQGEFIAVKKAINTSAGQMRGPLFMARSNGASGSYIKATTFGTIRDVDTSGDTLLDAYFVGSTAGNVAKTTTGFGRQVGVVSKVATVVNGGKIQFNGLAGGAVSGGGGVIAGIATFVSGQATVTVTQATLGGAALGGKPVVATFNSTDTTNTILSAVWSSNNLVITRTAGDATTPTVAYMVSVA